MLLTELELTNFRSFASQQFKLSRRTVILGGNGAGKTTAIEAIRLLSVGKSFRTSRTDEIISFEQPYLRAEAKRESGSSTEKLAFFYGQAFADQPNPTRQLSLNGKDVNLIDYIGHFPSVLFVPGDLEVVIGSPQSRRKYVDGILWQVSPEFRAEFLDLNRVLKERSALLFLLKIRRAGLAELEPWNELLTKLTAAIRTKRQDYLKFVADQAADQPALNFHLDYLMGAAELDDKLIDQEIRLGQNLFGPHRDEIEINFEARSARRFASRGQARTVILRLKALEAEFLSERTQQAPIILLDDMFSELDQKNAEQLFDELAADAQIIATSIQKQPLLKDWSVIELNYDR